MWLSIYIKNTMKDHNDEQHKQLQEISGLIRNYRYNEGLSQVELSAMAGIHSNSLSNIENINNFQIITLLKLIDATGLTLGEFFWGME